MLRGVGIDEHLGEALPLDLSFRDENDNEVRLREYFDGQRPVILTMNYSNCPMLCSLELKGLVKGLKQLEWSAGQQFRLVTVSFDPRESPSAAARTRRGYLDDYDRPGTEQGWHFLVGSESNVRALADVLGFRYRYDEKKDQYYHAPAIVIAMPDGHIGRYLYGIQFDPRTLRLGLVESSQGKVGTTVDRLILFCCAYDPKEGSYAVVAMRVMTIGCLLTLAVLGAALAILWRAEARKPRRANAAVQSDSA